MTRRDLPIVAATRPWCVSRCPASRGWERVCSGFCPVCGAPTSRVRAGRNCRNDK
ncbi:MAG: hypothetical protein DME18_13855 [Verrucomicrobia bacterium]|nr:MAG: hypothetical protein DME18_13855 [Verrucomicrobiota bacterium]